MLNPTPNIYNHTHVDVNRMTGEVCIMSNWGKIKYRKERGHYAVVGRWKGKRIYLSQYQSQIGMVTCTTREMAFRLREAIRADIDQGVFSPKKYQSAKPHHLKNYAPKWLAQNSPEWSTATYADYKNSLYKHILPVLGDKYLDHINYDNLKDLMNAINRKPKGKKNVLDCLKRLLKDAKRSGHISQMPEFPKFKGKNKIVKPLIRYINHSDQLHILTHIPLKHRPIFMFMMATGCRPSEARALRKKDIEDSHIMFAVSFGRMGELKPVKQTKAEPFPLTREIREIFDNNPGNLTPWVFPNPDTMKPYDKNINRIWNEACKKAGVKAIRLYQAVRHSFACQLLNSGMDKGKVSRLLRHSDIRMIERYAEYELEPLANDIDNIRFVDKRGTNKNQNDNQQATKQNFKK